MPTHTLRPSAIFSCLTLLQPWASFVMWGIKTWETRSRNIGIPLGTLLIHASKRVDRVGEGVYLDVVERLIFERRHQVAKVAYPFPFPRWEELPRGVILGHVNVSSTMVGDDMVPSRLTELEKMVGDFTPGRHFARLEEPTEFPKPIPWSGQRGVWKVRITV